MKVFVVVKTHHNRQIKNKKKITKEITGQIATLSIL
jgi:hypothetical protein